MPLLVSGWVVWNSGSLTHPNFVPKEIYPPALQIAEISETVYATRQECQAAINAKGGAHGYSAAGAAGGLGSGVVGPAGSAVQGTATGINAIGDFFGKLGEKNTWLRVIEIGVGAMIGYVGLKAMFPQAINTVSAPVKKAGKAAMFL